MPRFYGRNKSGARFEVKRVEEVKKVVEPVASSKVVIDAPKVKVEAPKAVQPPKKKKNMSDMEETVKLPPSDIPGYDAFSSTISPETVQFAKDNSK